MGVAPATARAAATGSAAGSPRSSSSGRAASPPARCPGTPPWSASARTRSPTSSARSSVRRARAAYLQYVLFFNVTTSPPWTRASRRGADLVVWTPDALGSICFPVASELAFAEAGHAWFSWRPSDPAPDRLPPGASGPPPVPPGGRDGGPGAPRPLRHDEHLRGQGDREHQRGRGRRRGERGANRPGGGDLARADEQQPAP